MGDQLSAPALVNFGVPQGSTLGPLMFIAVMNDITCKMDDIQLTVYADDVQLLLEGHTDKIDEIKARAVQGINNLQEWYNDNGLKLNSSKTQTIVIGPKTKTTKFLSDHQLGD